MSLSRTGHDACRAPQQRYPPGLPTPVLSRTGGRLQGEVAVRKRTRESTVRYRRHPGIGPHGFKVGRRVLYREANVQAWLDGLRRQSEIARS